MRARARELGLSPGRLPPGPLNSITDVAGVAVGHHTLVSGRDVRTGVTAIVPAPGDVYDQRLLAGGFVLNGAGELSGLAQLREWGLIETPIVLTNTLAVADAQSALIDYTLERAPGLGRSTDVVIPLVGECDDSWVHDARGRHVKPEHVRAALAAARAGHVPEGNVGAGTGMITCDFAGGIGTSSRQVLYPHAAYTVGVLVLSNFGTREDLLMDGLRVGEHLRAYAGTTRRTSFGSIVAVLATDAPLLPMQLSRICKRMALGMCRAGSNAAHGSGEIALAFSTAQRVPRERKSALWQLTCLYDADLNPLFQAAAEATEEAILNAVCAGTDLSGIDGHHSPALPLAELRKLVPRRSGVDDE
jgi:D-aminopeptidase